MSGERKLKPEDRKIAILSELIVILGEASKKSYDQGVKTMQSKADVDGPWQSKQPDEMIKIELQAGWYNKRGKDFKKSKEEVEDLLEREQNGENGGTGSVLIWEMKDPEHEGPIEETVVITPSGGGEIGSFRLLSEEAPLAKLVRGKLAGQKVDFGEISVTIKEII